MFEILHLPSTPPSIFTDPDAVPFEWIAESEWKTKSSFQEPKEQTHLSLMAAAVWNGAVFMGHVGAHFRSSQGRVALDPLTPLHSVICKNGSLHAPIIIVKLRPITTLPPSGQKT